jgi:hypothetical protein
MSKEFFPPRPESRRDSSIQPKVAESARLPWVRRQNGFNPNGVASAARVGFNPVGVGKIWNNQTQGRRKLRQPWAERCNPVGIAN